MKKTLIALAIIILVGLGIYFSQTRRGNNENQNSNSSMDEMSPTPATPSPQPNPSATPPSSSPAPQPASPQPGPAPAPSPTTPTPQPASPSPAPQVKTFNVTGHNFAFSTSEIKVKKGDTVKINFSSTDGFHNWTLEGYGVGTQSVNPGTPTSVEFVADKAGTFVYYCSVGNHRQMGMVGQLIVE